MAVDYLNCGLSRIYSPEEIDMFNKVNKTKFNNLVPFVKDRAAAPGSVKTYQLWMQAGLF